MRLWLPHRKKNEKAIQKMRTETIKSIEEATRATRRVNDALENDGITLVLKKAMGGNHGR